MPLLLRSKRWHSWHKCTRKRSTEWAADFPWLVLTSTGLGCSSCWLAGLQTPWAHNKACFPAAWLVLSEICCVAINLPNQMMSVTQLLHRQFLVVVGLCGMQTAGNIAWLQSQMVLMLMTRRLCCSKGSCAQAAPKGLWVVHQLWD